MEGGRGWSAVSKNASVRATRCPRTRVAALAHVTSCVYFFMPAAAASVCPCCLFSPHCPPRPPPLFPPFSPGLLCSNSAMGYETYNPYTSAPPVVAKPPAGVNPLHGFLPRKVTAEQVTKAMVCPSDLSLSSTYLSVFQESDVNPFTRQPHTPQYKKILEGRKKLPVFGQMDEFLKMVRHLSTPYHIRGGQSLLQAYGTPGAEERH